MADPSQARARIGAGRLLVLCGFLLTSHVSGLTAQVWQPLSMAGIDLDGTAERRVAVVTISALLGAAMMVGMFWNTRRWAIVSLIFYGITIPLFTTEFTNLRGGITSDFWGSLAYWIAQQEVRRGEQPWFYYSMMVPLYEFLTLIPALIGGWWLLERRHGLAAPIVWWWRMVRVRRKRARLIHEEWHVDGERTAKR